MNTVPPPLPQQVVEGLWFYTDSANQPVGPLPFAALQQLAAVGVIRPVDYVREKGTTEWVRFDSISSPVMSAPNRGDTQAAFIAPQLESQSSPNRCNVYKRTCVQVLHLIFLACVQVPVMCLLKAFSLRARIILSVVAIFLIIVRFVPHLPDSTGSSNSSDSALSIATKPVSREQPIYWSEIDAIYNLRSRNTDLQKREEWKRFKGKSVTWSGEVSSISDGFGGLSLQIKMNSTTLVSDLLVHLKRSERTKALRLQKGDSVIFTGILNDWGTLLPITLDDGEIK